MTTLTEKVYVADLVKRELEENISRKLVTLASSSGVLARGTVLGTVTASGKYAPYNPTLSDGTQLTGGVAVTVASGGGTVPPGNDLLAILLDDAVDTTADVPNVRVLYALAVVDSAFLVWGAGVTTGAHKTAAYAGMAASQLIVLNPA